MKETSKQMKNLLRFIRDELKSLFRKLICALQELRNKRALANDNVWSRLIFLVRFPGHFRVILLRLLLDFHFVSKITDFIRKHSNELGVFLVSLSIILDVLDSNRLNHIQSFVIFLLSLLVIDFIASKLTGLKEDLNNDLLYLNLMLFYINLLNIILFFLDHIVKIIHII